MAARVISTALSIPGLFSFLGIPHLGRLFATNKISQSFGENRYLRAKRIPAHPCEALA
jgi:hypothetical protein